MKTVFLGFVGILLIMVISGYVILKNSAVAGDTILKNSFVMDDIFFNNIAINQNHGFKDRVTALAFNKNSTMFAVGYESGKVDVFDGKSLKLAYGFFPSSTRTDILNFSNNGNYLSTGGYFDGNTKIYDLTNGTLKFNINESMGRETFTNDGDFIYMADTGSFKVFDLKKESFVGKTYECDGVITSIGKDKNENYLAVGMTGSIQIFEINGFDPTVLKLVSTQKPYELQDWITHVWFDKKDMSFIDTIFDSLFYHKSTTLITISRFGHVDKWSVPELKKIDSIHIVSTMVQDALISEDGKYVIILGINENRRDGEYFVERINLETKKSEIIGQLSTNSSNITSWFKKDGVEYAFVEHNGKKELVKFSDK
ncbi:MAG: WD40 repeat domain-containing protein [Sulfuricurvum sp.]|uniref:WD40 repeat domain-containing protein n=1 Tax=Sulfuricurvum sp. TaxID=2025608 RepID=UPI002637E5DA|nr:WD40 repeat domain-containing protein [Sulfuricurvum sp.]MDD5158820.1 WD40 repeat domain-containing protein [Sulfuricurvum sp.]